MPCPISGAFLRLPVDVFKDVMHQFLRYERLEGFVVHDAIEDYRHLSGDKSSCNSLSFLSLFFACSKR